MNTDESAKATDYIPWYHIFHKWTKWVEVSVSLNDWRGNKIGGQRLRRTCAVCDFVETRRF